MTTWSSTTVKDALVLLGDTWVRLSAVEAVCPTKAYAPPAAIVHLASGTTLHVKIPPDDVLKALGRAMGVAS